MKITSSSELVDKALKEIKTITIDEAHSRMIEGKSNIIDIRDIRELQNEGKVDYKSTGIFTFVNNFNLKEFLDHKGRASGTILRRTCIS